MLDANSTLTGDPHFANFAALCGLNDLHDQDPAPSTYIGSQDRRIDYILACDEAYTYVSRSGTLSYQEGPQSDHRSLFVDINTEFFRRPPWQGIQSSAARSLHTGNPELVSRYNISMMEYYEQHNMVARLEALYDKQTILPREEVRKLLIQWDNDQGRAMEKSGRILRRPPKKCSWSPALRNSAIVRRYWTLGLRECQHGGDYSETFHRWQSQIQKHYSSFRFQFFGEPLRLE